MRRLHLVGGGIALVAIGGLVAWRATRPAGLGLERSRVVLTSGDVTVDGTRARPMQLLAIGSTLRTGHGNACFSVHGSRVCVGAGAEVSLVALGEASATIEAKRGTVIVGATRDDVHLTLPTGTVIASAGTVAVEDAAGSNPTARVLEGSAAVSSTGQPEATLSAPAAIGLKDGKKRPAAPTLEAEERSAVELARSWQGSAGAVIEFDGLHGRVEIDGADVGLAPAAVLLAEGSHTLIVRDGGRELTHETVTLVAGQKLVRGG